MAKPPRLNATKEAFRNIGIKVVALLNFYNGGSPLKFYPEDSEGPSHKNTPRIFFCGVA